MAKLGFISKHRGTVFRTVFSLSQQLGEPNQQGSSPRTAEPTEKVSDQSATSGYLRVLLVGIFLGIVFVKSEVATWERVHRMFRFEQAHMYLIIALGIAVSAICMWLIKKYHVRDVQGKPIVYEPKPFNPGVVIGGMMFGAGWAITGACPGPIYAQIGGGEFLAFVTLAAAMLGMFCFAWLKPKLP